jgi:hypothetical protein
MAYSRCDARSRPRGAIAGLAASPLLASSILAPRRREQQQHGGRVEQQRNHENEPSQDRLVVGAKQRREVPHRAKVGLDGAALALDTRLLDFQISEGLRLDRELVGKASALDLPSFVVCPR